MNSTPDQTKQDNDPSDGYGPSETPRSSQGDQVDSCFTCSTCGKSWPSNRSRASHQVHCRKAQERNQRSNASRPDLRQSSQTGNGPVHNHSANPTGKSFLHQKKDHVNIKETCESMESMPRLNLPNAGDIGAWKELDEEQSEALSPLVRLETNRREVVTTPTLVGRGLSTMMMIKMMMMIMLMLLLLMMMIMISTLLVTRSNFSYFLVPIGKKNPCFISYVC